MKVQIVISKKAAMMATATLLQAADKEKDQELLNQAIERCKQEVTEVNLDDMDIGDQADLIACGLYMAAIGKRAKEIEEEGKE